MATLDSRIQDLTIRIAQECKNIRSAMAGGMGDMSTLTTTNKTNLVLALNEIKTTLMTLDSTNLKIDGTQNLTDQQKLTLATTIGALSSTAVGPTDTDYVALFLTGLM